MLKFPKSNFLFEKSIITPKPIILFYTRIQTRVGSGLNYLEFDIILICLCNLLSIVIIKNKNAINIYAYLLILLYNLVAFKIKKLIIK